MKNTNTRAYDSITSAKKLTNEEINKLVARYNKEKSESKKADISQVLVEQYIKLIFKMSHPFANAYGDINDAIQNGVLGLYDAIDKYDPNRNANFGTFAFICIYNSIYSGYGYSFFNVPRHVKHAIAQMNRSDKQGQELGTQDFENIVDASPKRKAFIKKFSKDRDKITKVSSLSAPIASDGGTMTLEDVVADKSASPEEIVVAKNLFNKINDIIDNSLSERERIVIRKRYFHGDGAIKTLHEIGKDLNISFEAVRLIEKAAAEKIKKKLKVY
jgi:RNA polymerase sigma factor (sigma-70 family)